MSSLELHGSSLEAGDLIIPRTRYTVRSLSSIQRDGVSLVFFPGMPFPSGAERGSSAPFVLFSRLSERRHDSQKQGWRCIHPLGCLYVSMEQLESIAMDVVRLKDAVG